MEILSKQAAEGVEYAIDRIAIYESMKYEEKEDYFVFYDEDNKGP